MLRRLFPWPVTIASYSPEPQFICAAEQVHQFGAEVCPEIVKTSAIGVFSCILVGGSYDFGGFMAAVEVFQAKTRSQHRVWMLSAEVDALFRCKGSNPMGGKTEGLTFIGNAIKTGGTSEGKPRAKK